MGNKFGSQGETDSGLINVRQITAPKRGRSNANDTYSEVIKIPVVQIVEKLNDQYHLTKAQAKFLMHRHMFMTDRDCANFMGCSPGTVQTWRKRGSSNTGKGNFPDAYRDYNDQIKYASEKTMNLLGMKAVLRTEEFMDASRTVPGPNNTWSTEPDYNTRAKGVEIYSRWQGLWNPRAQEQQSNTYVAVFGQFNEMLAAKMAGLTGKSEQIVEGEVVDDDS